MRVGPYQLEAQLGRGGMGSVWIGVHEATGARHAVKLLDLGDDAELRARFGREAEALGRLGAHPNLVAVHGSGVDAGRPWLAMELVTGGDLGGRLRSGPLPPRDVVALGQALAAGLAHAHARGVLHRDLKPGNVVFGEDGAPRLVDFGVARVAGAAALTRTGGVLGTPGYSAPEQLGGAEVDARADVYGLGAVLYHALTGRPPCQAATPIAAVAGALQGPPAPTAVAPALRGDPLGPGLEALVLRALAFDPAARFASADELRQALEELGRAPPASAPASGRWALLVGGLLALSLVALALLASVASPRPPAGPTPPGAAPVVTPTPTPHPPPPSSSSSDERLLDELLQDLCAPDELLALAAGRWAEPAARPALVTQVGAALLLSGAPAPGWVASTAGLSPADADWLAACTGDLSPVAGEEARSIQAVLPLVRELAEVRQREERPAQLLEVIPRLLEAGERACGRPWMCRLLRVVVQRALLEAAEPLVQFTRASLKKRLPHAKTAHALLRRAAVLEPGPDAQAIEVMHRWALSRSKELAPELVPPAPVPGLALPRRLALLALVHALLAALEPPFDPAVVDEAEALRRAAVGILADARRLGRIEEDGLPRRANGSLEDLLRDLFERLSEACMWDAWRARGGPDAARTLEAAREAAQRVTDPTEGARHRARVHLMAGEAELARRALEVYEGEEVSPWRAVFLVECDLLAGDVPAAARRVQSIGIAVGRAQRAVIAAALDPVDEAQVDRLLAQVDPGVTCRLIPWRGGAETHGQVAAERRGWRPRPGAPPWPPADR